MRRYSDAEEERIRLLASVRDWARAGLLDAAQVERITPLLATDLKRTNLLLRLAIAGFTAVIVAAAVGLMFVAFGIRGDLISAATLAIGALVAFQIADALAGSGRLYRHGAEEMLAVIAAVMVGVAAAVFASSTGGSAFHLDVVVGLAAAAAAGAVVYLRFGLVYAAVGATICAGLVPLQFTMPESTSRMCAAAIFAGVFIVARTLYRNQGDDYPGDDYAVIEAAACVCMYLSLNLFAFDEVVSWLFRPSIRDADAFYWATYVVTWLIPAVVLADAIRAKDRALLVAGLAMALVTLATNKPYLGRPRQTWDPMLLGALLIGGTVGVRRWLASGPAGTRRGYTADRAQAGEIDLLQAAANVSVAWHDRIHDRPAPSDQPSQFQGGRSGGGGASGSF